VFPADIIATLHKAAIDSVRLNVFRGYADLLLFRKIYRIWGHEIATSNNFALDQLVEER
jgi:hypothetical protein